MASGTSQRWWRWAGAGLVLVWLTGCAAYRTAQVPMPSLSVPVEAGRTAPALIVFLPGAQEVPKDILDEGLVAEVKRQGLDADVIVADAHMGYFRAGSFEERLRADVVAPARQRGYQTVWLAGISLGGFGAMRYARAYPDDVDGVVALAPFVATTDVLREVAEAGGLLHWRPMWPLQPGDHQRELLRWLQGYVDPGLNRPPLYIGYGETDRLQPYEPLMVPLLPPDRLLSAPGGHEWAPWKKMWADVLQRLPLPRLPGYQAVVQR